MTALDDLRGASLATILVILATTLTSHASRNVARALRQGDKGNVEPNVTAHLRHYLIAVQVSRSVALLVGTGLTERSLLQLGRVDAGIQTQG